MLKKENHYDFRARLDAVHRTDRRDPDAKRADGEFELKDGLKVSCPAGADEAVQETAKDLVDYLLVSMGVSAMPATDAADAAIALSIDPAVGKPGTFRFVAGAEGIRITGADEAGVRRGGVYLEDLLNLREGPFYRAADTTREPLFSLRLVHSAWGLELFPDAQLNAILHAGFNGIFVFYEGPDRTHIGILDFRSLIRRARRYGLKVFFYSYLPFDVAPDDPRAEAYYGAQYTKMFELYPDAAGVGFCCEDFTFPTKDPRAKGGNWHDNDPTDTRPGVYHYPCSDTPDLIRIIRDAVRKAKPDATVIFNTYSWGYQPDDLREEFVKNMPDGVMLWITYEIFGYRRVLGQPERLADYSITADKPAYYFRTESAYGAKYGHPLFCTSNTGGRTWDFGDAPYIPCVQRWLTRFKYLDQYRRERGLTGLYECHHYGWWPSAITEIGKAYFNSPQCDLEEELKRQARRLAGDGADDLLRAWDLWSQAMAFFPSDSDDQYGPLRVGPSYPMLFDTAGKLAPPFPCTKGAHFGNRIITTNYNVPLSANPMPVRYPMEIKALEKFDELWSQGLAAHERALAKAHPFRTEELEYEQNMARFLLASARTCKHMKQLRLLNCRINAATDVQTVLAELDNMERLFDAEEANAKAAIPLVEADSSLGWEGSMEYVCDREHLEWKLSVLAGARRNLDKCRNAMRHLFSPSLDLDNYSNNV